MYSLLNIALAEIPKVKADTIFLVKDLFKGYEWMEFSINDRRNLGRFFCEPTLNPYLLDGTIVALDKNKSNQQLYKKVK